MSAKWRISIVAFACIGSVFALVLMLSVATSKRAPRHDGGIAFLAASGKQASFYERANSLGGEWRAAAEWQALWAPPTSPNPSGVAQGLRETDVHPPLYFWSLHAISIAFGASVFMGILWNGCFVFGTALLIGWTLRRFRVDVSVAFFAGSTFALSSGSLMAMTEVRPYSLLALLVAGVLASTVAIMQERDLGGARSIWKRVALSLAVAGGLLTHFQFGIVVASLFVALGLMTLAKGWHRTIWHACACACTGMVAAVLLHPGFWDSINRLRTTPALDSSIEYRVGRTISSLLKLALPSGWAAGVGRLASTSAGILLLSACLIAALGIATVLVVRRVRRDERTKLYETIAIPATMGIVVLSSVVLLYLIGQSPRHAMGPKYLVIALPTVLVALGIIIQAKRMRMVVLALFAFQIITAASLAKKLHREGPCSIGSPSLPIAAENPSRGQLIGLLWCAEPTQQVFVSKGALARADVAAVDQLTLFHSSDQLPAKFKSWGFEVKSKAKLWRAHGWLLELSAKP